MYAFENIRTTNHKLSIWNFVVWKECIVRCIRSTCKKKSLISVLLIYTIQLHDDKIYFKPVVLMVSRAHKLIGFPFLIILCTITFNFNFKFGLLRFHTHTIHLKVSHLAKAEAAIFPSRVRLFASQIWSKSCLSCRHLNFFHFIFYY